MKKTNKKLPIFLGIACALLLAVSSWYTVTFNDSRWLEPMDLSGYVFRAQDLPMLLSVSLTCLYVGYLFILLILAIIDNWRKKRARKPPGNSTPS